MGLKDKELEERWKGERDNTIHIEQGNRKVKESMCKWKCGCVDRKTKGRK